MTLASNVREALGLTPTEAYRQLIDSTAVRPYDNWMQWENGRKSPSAAVVRYFEAILVLAEAKEQKISGADMALDLVLGQRGPINGSCGTVIDSAIL